MCASVYGRRRNNVRHECGDRFRFAPCLEVLEDRRVPSIFSVTNTADSGPGSLRQAILDANANPGADMITFNIPGPNPHVIQPSSSDLPTITDSVFIDGTTQPGYIYTPLIQLDGALLGGAGIGLSITASSCKVRALAITHHWVRDAQALASTGDDGTVRLWRAPVNLKE